MTVTTGPARRDVAAHATVCARPGPRWNARCRCRSLAVRHEDLVHTSLPAGRGVTRTGRNLAGRCRDCNNCPRFTPTPKENAHA